MSKFFFISPFLLSFFLFPLFKSANPSSFEQPPLKHYPRKLENSSSEAQKYYDSHQHTFKLSGSFDLGYYYVDLFIGTPSQKQTVIVDTGSSLTAVPCSGLKI